MSSDKQEQTYKVWRAGNILEGLAEDVIRKIQEQASPESGIKNLQTESYARTIVESASDFVPRPILDAIDQLAPPTVYSHAIEVLASMPASGITVLARPKQVWEVSSKGRRRSTEARQVSRVRRAS